MITTSRGAFLLAVALLLPACNLRFSMDDLSGGPPPPNPFTLQVPVDNSTGALTVNTQFAWGALPGAQSYQIQISLTSSFAQVLYDEPAILTPSVFVSAGLTHSTVYYWRVYGHKAGAPPELAAGSPSRFTTIPPPFSAPGQFFLQSPIGGPVNTFPAPVFLWSVSTGASSYWFQLDTSSFFTAPIADLPNLHQNQVTCPVALAPSTTYYWKVTAMNVHGQTFSSPLSGSFVTAP